MKYYQFLNMQYIYYCVLAIAILFLDNRSSMAQCDPSEPTITGPDQVCFGDTDVSYYTPTPGEYKWIIQNGVIIEGENSNKVNVSWTGNEQGLLTLVVISVCNSNSIVETKQVTKEIVINTASIGGYVTPNHNICLGNDTKQLKVEDYSGNISKWQLSTDNGISWVDKQDTTETITDTPQNSGSYYYRAIIKNGACPESASSKATVNVITPPDVYFTKPFTDVNECNIFIDLASAYPEGGKYSGIGVDNNKFNPKIAGLGTHEITYTYSLSGCSIDVMQTITVNTLPDINAGLDRQICNNEVTLNGSEPIEGTTGNWEVLEGDGIISNPLENNTQVSDLSFGKNTFIWNITYINGCVVKDTVVITNNLPEINLDDISVCSNSATLNGNLIGSAIGTWTTECALEILEPNNPHSVITNLTSGDNVLTWTIVDNDCTASENINILYNHVPIVDAGNDDAICQTTITLNANKPENGNGYWTVIEGNAIIENPENFNATATNLTERKNVFKWTISNSGCSNSDEIEIISNAVQISAGDDMTICTDTTSLNANKPEESTGYWEIIEGECIFADPISPHTKIFDVGNNKNIFRWVVSDEICTTSDDIIIINNIVSANAGVDKITCIDNFQLEANAPDEGASGSWIVESADVLGIEFEDNSKYDTEVYGLSKGIGKFRWIVKKHECVSYSDVLITNKSLNAKISIEHLNVTCKGACDGAAVAHIDNQNDYLFNWQAEESKKIISTRLIENLCPGTYIFTVKDTISECTISQSINILEPKYKMEISSIVQNPDCNVCNGSIELKTRGGNEPYEYKFNGVKAESNYLGELCDGIYLYSVSDKNDCIISDTLYVNTLEEIPVPELIGNKTVYENTTTHVEIYTDIYSKLWIVVGGAIVESNIDSTYIKIKWGKSGYGTVTLKVFTPCTEAYSKTLEVKILDMKSVKNKNIVTPNGDGINDKFEIKEIENCHDCFPDNELLIYDHWGGLIYSIKGYNNDWDGEANQGLQIKTILPNGIYYYIFKLNNEDNERDGYFEIKRP